MIKGLFGAGSLSSMLRGGLEETTATHRTIAARVSGALASSTSTDFASALDAQTSQQRLSEVDLEREMVALADTQLRFEADAKLLTEAYSRLRTAIRDRG